MTDWPSLPYEEWRDTRDTLHMYTQVLGKMRLALNPFEPEWSQVPLYVTARGLTTSTMPVGSRSIDAELDLLSHQLVIRSSDGRTERLSLGGDVASFYDDTMKLLHNLDVDMTISVLPSEVPDPIPFPEDHEHSTYAGDRATRFFQVLTRVDQALKAHRAGFRGRTTLVQFYWGTFDLALTRYSGRPAEPPSNAGLIRRVAGDAEAICAGWWPGDDRVRFPAFFAYGYPSPEGIGKAPVRPEAAAWNAGMGEFILPYEAIRSGPDPDSAVRQFLDSTYEAEARLMNWDRALTDVVAPPRAGGLRQKEKSR